MPDARTKTDPAPPHDSILLPLREDSVVTEAVPVRAIRVEGVYAPGGTGPVGVTVAIGDIR